ncbi:phosphoglycerate mutase-like protein [Eremomyces bilateralis CBS 781.70]|uniref:Phosphoglycerate mutase-like protein n=1 Tax=Eremomyces bilateralis CBS 781.70 TaxID=1392243 RepID=A0A6G1G1G0_9PEZI|nr:phosphoglycerate mutase-like protein [Eremomyces bilateralis CBS 781.70]KAF1811760.1 phosphoglycerate mutase-like protein [Eremomyces bilateralis CBS 781.70]
MVLEVIYIVRHGYRSNWSVNHETGVYHSSVPTPTGIPADPALSSYGVDQSKQLGDKLLSIDPPVDVVYSSPWYRCIQTIKPAIDKWAAAGGAKKVRVENGVGEFFGEARFEHPSPAPVDELEVHFPDIMDRSYTPVARPSTNGESTMGLHNRAAYALARIISDLDRDPKGPKSVVICTHAAFIIAAGRALTGLMPAEPEEHDFSCYTCGLSMFVRRTNHPTEAGVKAPVAEWDPKDPENIPELDWIGGKGVGGGWDCVHNSDCSFLKGGEERGW